tara:strand:+ start:461 stop:967 length:507 start_codon:yes stop_codon:yes gene_type:complete
MYKIEGDINFYEELNKNNDTNDDYKEQLCLITNEALTDKFVQLDCGHMFNYKPLYNSFVKYKMRSHQMRPKRKIEEDSLVCPYCRKQQKNKIPYYKELGVKHIDGITCKNNVNTLFCTAILKCGANNGCTCKSKQFSGGFCKRHFNMNLKAQLKSQTIEYKDISQNEI